MISRAPRSAAAAERVVFFNAGGPVFSCSNSDRMGLRLAAVTVVEQGLAGATAVAAALGLHRVTLFRDARKVRKEGVEGWSRSGGAPRARTR